MKNAMIYDPVLHIEAYRLTTYPRPFPPHFHDYYTIGLMESGSRALVCGNRQYTVTPGSIMIVHPMENHSCAQTGDAPMSYRAVNIPEKTMRALNEEITGASGLPVFRTNVIQNGELSCLLRTLHIMLMEQEESMKKEESLLFFMEALIQGCAESFSVRTSECPGEIARACEFIEQNFTSRLTLDQICRHAALSKSTLLRSFTRAKGVTPYCYLENLRISQAKKLLREGVSPADAASRTGFSDQSHFTNYFTRFIGLTPGTYRDIFFRERKEKNGN